jgi:hypothetical protein
VYFFMLIRQVRMSGLGDVPMSQLPAKINSGHRMRQNALELAAIVALVLVTFNPFKG